MLLLFQDIFQYVKMYVYKVLNSDQLYSPRVKTNIGKFS